MDRREWERVGDRVRRKMQETTGSVTLHFKDGEFQRAEYRYFEKKEDMYEVTATAA